MSPLLKLVLYPEICSSTMESQGDMSTVELKKALSNVSTFAILDLAPRILKEFHDSADQ